MIRWADDSTGRFLSCEQESSTCFDPFHQASGLLLQGTKVFDQVGRFLSGECSQESFGHGREPRVAAEEDLLFVDEVLGCFGIDEDELSFGLTSYEP